VASTPAEIQTSMESLIVARISILMRNAFFGNLVTRLQLKVKEDIETAATDGRSIFFNPAFINKLKKKDCEFVCLHEILHAILEHAGVDSRLVGRNPSVITCECHLFPLYFTCSRLKFAAATVLMKPSIFGFNKIFINFSSSSAGTRTYFFVVLIKLL